MFTRDRVTGEQIIQVFGDFKEYSLGYQCKGICEHHELRAVGKRHKGYTQQSEGIKRCKRCCVNWKPEVGIRCPCCNQRVSSRVKSKQSRMYREQQRIIKEYEQSVEGKYFWYSCDGCEFDTPSHIQSFFHKKETGHTRTIKEVDISFVQNLVKRLGNKS